LLAVPVRPAGPGSGSHLPRTQRPAAHLHGLHRLGRQKPEADVVRRDGAVRPHLHCLQHQDRSRNHCGDGCLMAVSEKTTAPERPEQPRSLADARRTYSTNSELAWWVFMRVSGLLMIIIVGAHVFMTNILIDVGDVDFEFVSTRLSPPWLKLFYMALLVLALLHGANGLRYSIEDYNRRAGRRFVWKIVLYTVTIGVMVMGLISLWGIDYSQFDEPMSLLNGW